MNPIQDDPPPQKRSPTNFSTVTSTNVETIPQNSVTFGFNPFATLV